MSVLTDNAAGSRGLDAFGYSITLSFNNNVEILPLPVMPPSIAIKGDVGSKTYNIIGFGDVNVIKSQELKTISFESYFPAWHKNLSAHPPAWYVQRIETWMTTGRPVRFIFSGPYEINAAVSIESFEWSESAGEGGDLAYKISLKEYVFYAAQKVPIKPAGSSAGTAVQKQAPPRPNEKQTPKTYTLVAGDTLLKVAKKLLGDDSRWREIQKLNGISDAQLRQLPIGMVLKLPS